ncbi:MAG: carbohydrate-binding protein, partial [Acidobacteriota bacterium]
IYGTWAASGEIDVMEYIGSEPDRVFGTIHYGASFPGNVFSSTDTFLPSGTFADDFYVYAIEWEFGEIRWYLNDVLYAQRDSWFSTGGPFPAPFDVDFHLLLNLAVGGNLPGSPDASTVFPQEFVVDYVRVYQAPNTPPSVTIVEPTAQDALEPGQPLVIRVEATDDSAVSQVEFLQGNAVLGTDDSAPYELTVPAVAAGCYSLRARARDDQGVLSVSAPVEITVGSGCPQAPYRLTPAPIPGVIEVEDYDLGGPGVAYEDFDAVNAGGAYRADEGVDLEGTTDVGFGFNVGFVQDGEWLEYTVDGVAGTYDVVLRVASNEDGGALRLELDGVDVTGPLAFPGTGGWQNWRDVTFEDIAFAGDGLQTLRVQMLDEDFNLNRITIQEPLPPEPPGPLVFDDMEHGNPFGNGWFTFGGSVGGGGINPEPGDVRPGGGAFSLTTGWGSGGVPGFFGGFGRTFPLDLTGAETFSFWINPNADQDYTLEINLQDDDNGDNVTSPPDDDEFQYLCVVSPAGPCAIAGGGWQQVTIPLEDFERDRSFLFGGNGVFDPFLGDNGQLINVAMAVIGNSGSDVNFRTDDWIFGVPVEPVGPAIWDDFEDGNAFDWAFFGGNAAGGGGGVLFDRPLAGTAYLSTGWGGQGSESVFYGGLFKNVPEADQLPTPNDPWFNVWVLNQSDATADAYTLEITLREDLDGSGWTSGQEDSFRLDTTFESSEFNDRWTLVSAPLSDFLDLGTGGDGVFNGRLDEVVVVISGVQGAPGSTVEVDFDDFVLTGGGPLDPCITDSFEDGDFEGWSLDGLGHANQFSAEVVGGALELTSDGATAYLGRDNAGFLYREVVGDFRVEATVDVTEMDTGKIWRKAGLSARASLDSLDLRLLATAAPGQERLQFVARTRYAGRGNVKLGLEVPEAPPVVDLALQRVGQTLSVQYSLDGRQTWITPADGLGGSVEIVDLPASLLVGPTVVSNNISVTSTARFDDVGFCPVR